MDNHAVPHFTFYLKLFALAHISLMPCSPQADRVMYGHLAAGGLSRVVEKLPS